MPKEFTLVIIKPDGVRKNLPGAIKQRYEDQGLKIVTEKRVHLSTVQAEALYAEHRGKHFFDGAVLAMVSGPSVVLLLAGDDAVRNVRILNGTTRDAEPGTIRGDYPSAGGPFNMVHGSDSVEAAEREIAVIFPDERDRSAAA